MIILRYKQFHTHVPWIHRIIGVITKKNQTEKAIKQRSKNIQQNLFSHTKIFHLNANWERVFDEDPFSLIAFVAVAASFNSFILFLISLPSSSSIKHFIISAISTLSTNPFSLTLALTPTFTSSLITTAFILCSANSGHLTLIN